LPLEFEQNRHKTYVVHFDGPPIFDADNDRDKEKHRAVHVADLLQEIQAERFFPFVADAHIEDSVSMLCK
jgi:hypothetical protein